jgi:hypothetical protein
MAIDASVGGSASNSYVTLAEATAHFANRHPSTAWDDASAGDKERALLTATVLIEQMEFRGSPVKPLTDTSNEQTQALRWPRHGVQNDEGWTYLENVIPERLKRAQMELAYFLLSEDVKLGQTGLEGFNRAKVGPLEVDIRHAQRAGTLPENVRRELRPLLVSGAVTVPLVRS